MRIAILTSHPIQYYAPLFRSLAEMTDIHVFYAHQPTPQQQGAAGFGASFGWDIDLTSGYPHSFLRNVATAPSTARFSGCDTPDIGDALRNGSFDVVLALGWHLKPLIQGIWAAKRLNMPVMVRGDSQLTTPRSSLKRLTKEFLYPPFLRVFDAALYVGVRSREYYVHYRYPAERLFHSPHCIDNERFATAATSEARTSLRSRLGIAEDERLVLFAGKLLDFKRPLDCLEALALLRNRGLYASMLVASSGPLETALKVRASELGVCLYYLGFKNQTEMPSAYAAADALVLSSSGRETWGLVCNEALACGCPIIVSDAIGCAPDLAADSHVGRTYPMGDVAALADALAALFKTPPTRAEILALSDRFSIKAAATGIVKSAKFVSTSR